jgi:metal-responsive CopG/Arc/MetJ family transcriptional regulator
MATKTVNISLPEKLLIEIDRKAKQEYRTRSELFKQAVILYIEKRDNWDVFSHDLSKQAKAMGIKNEDDVEELVDSIRK